MRGRPGGGSGSLGDPRGYPWGMPVYPNSKVKLTQVEDDLAKVTLTTSDSYDKVVSWYKKEIAANNIGGWELDKGRKDGGSKGDPPYMAVFWDKNKSEGRPDYGLALIVGDWGADSLVSINYQWSWESLQNR